MDGEGPRGWAGPLYAAVLDRTEVGPATTLLDLGCGEGLLARAAADRGAQVTGVDLDRNAVARTTVRVPEATFVVRNAQDPLSGTYQVRGQISARLVQALPRVLVVPDNGRLRPLLELTVAEIESDDPGQQAVLDRLLDPLLLSALREWFARPDVEPPAWYRALGDPVVGRALRLLHDAPARPWTVAGLAQEVGVSRATLARRFTDLVGEPPMTYLTGWRLCLAADLLASTDVTVQAVARRVGYESAFGLSVAFKRVYGTRPSEHRMAVGA